MIRSMLLLLTTILAAFAWVGVLVVGAQLHDANGQISQLQTEHVKYCQFISPSIPMESELHAAGC